jgi:hypothetical protein
MKKKYRKISRVRRLKSVQNLIYAIDDAIIILEENELITVHNFRRDIINTIINYIGDAGVLKPQYNPPYYLQNGYYKNMSQMALKDNTFIAKPETEYGTCSEQSER